MIAVVIWLLAWLFAGTPPVEPWTDFFAFLLAASVLSFSQALWMSNIGQTTIVTTQAKDENRNE